MAVAVALNYNFRPQACRFADQRKHEKAENSVISSHFLLLSVNGHCIKDSVKIDHLFLHDIGYEKFDIAHGDTLTEPMHWDDEPFEAIVCFPDVMYRSRKIRVKR